MSKRIFDVVLLTGAAHVVEAESIALDERGSMVFSASGKYVAYFSGVSSVIERPQPDPSPEPCAAGGLDSFPEPGSPALFGEAMLSGTVVINVHVDGHASANVVAEAVKSAINTVHSVV